MFALVDCNNFFASCERAFNPKLIGKPVVVLSNNDGCVIARSDEAKKIGIPMGAPVFENEELFEMHDVQAFSANFTLYGDMSQRVMGILSRYTPELEIYSIDEAFLSLDSLHIKNPTEYMRQIRELILRSTGIPVSIGIASTKTLAKIANHMAKKNKETGGVVDWNMVENQDEVLSKLPVGEVWGVGWHNTKKFNELGIYNIKQLKECDDAWIRKNFAVTTLRTVTELRGISCFKVEAMQDPKKGIISSRSFGKPVYELKELEEAVATYTSRACEKLRHQKSAATYIYVSIITNRFRPDQPQYYASKIVKLPSSTWYPPDLIKAAHFGLHQIYKKGYRYKKAMIMLFGIVPQSDIQLSYFKSDYDFEKMEKITDTIDKINMQFGTEFIKYAATGIRQRWRMKREQMSNRYTTSWKELLVVQN